MAVYIVTGKLGNGKTLVSVGRIRDKLRAGCLVATNLDLDLRAMLGPKIKNCRVLRVPDKPTAEDLHAIGNANTSYDENRNGLLVLDECGTWFNSRNWNDKARGPVNDWFLHARKLGWDVILIVQDISIVDSQARVAIAEHTVFCKRIDRLHIPVVGTFYKLCVGEPLRLPRVHTAKVVYGCKPDDPLSDRWTYRGTDLFQCYDTKQAFLSDYPHGVYTVLPPWYTHGRYQKPRNWRWYMRMTKIMWKRFKSPIALASGTLMGVAFTSAVAFGSIYQDMKAQIPEPSRQVEAVMMDVQPDVPRSDPLLEKLRNLRIVGSSMIGGSTYYDLAPLDAVADDDGDYRTVSSREFSAMGVKVFRRSDCHAVMTYRGNEIDIFCI